MIVEEEQLWYRIELVSLGHLYEYVIDAYDGTIQDPTYSTPSEDNYAPPAMVIP